MSTTVPLPSEEQKVRAKWDLLLSDLEYRAEQVRQAKTYEPRRIIIQAMTAAAAVFVAGAANGALLLRLLAGH